MIIHIMDYYNYHSLSSPKAQREIGLQGHEFPLGDKTK